MSLERLLQKIEDDGRAEGTRIVGGAKEEAARMKEAGEEEVRRSAEEIRSSYRERGERERTKIMSEALAESRGTFLSAQDDLFEEAFTEALRDFEELPEERYREWLKRIILDNVTIGEEQIVAAPYDRRLLEDGLLKEINGKLRKGKRKGALTLAGEEADFNRGVILRSEKFINNLSLETLMRQVRDLYEEDVLKMLFGRMDTRGGKQ